MSKFSAKHLLTFFIILCISLQIDAAESTHIPILHKEIVKKYLVKEIKVVIAGETDPINLENLQKEYLNKQIESDKIKFIEHKLFQYFLNKNYLFPHITISEKSLNNGTLDIQVTPKILNNVVLFNNGPDNKLIDEYVAKILAKKDIKIDYIEKYITLMNRIPGYSVDHEYRPSKRPNEIELILKISKDKIDMFASVDSYGSNDLGQMENYVSAQVFNSKGGNDAWSFSGSTTNHPDRLYNISAGYVTAINALGTNANVNISNSENNSTLQDHIHTTNGVTNTVSAGLNHLLYSDRKQSLTGEIDANYNSIIGYTLNDDNGNVKDTVSKYLEMSLSFNYFLFDQFHGNNNVNLKFSQGVSGYYANYTEPTDVPNKNYNIYQADLTRNQFLPHNFSIFSHILTGQSDHALPSSEQFSLGGREFGRGYASGIIVGNKIIAVSAEIRYNQEVDNNQWIESIQPYIFRDFGYVGKQSSDTTLSHISSYGAGLRFSIAFGVNVEGEVAQPMKKNYQMYGDPERSNTNYSAMIGKSFSF